MKVAEKSATNRDTRMSGAERFNEALHDARSRARAPSRRNPSGVERAGEPARALGTRRTVSERASVVLRERREAFGEAERQAPAASLTMTQPPPASPRPEGTSELRAVVRALPVAIEAARVREGAPLSLSLGRALSVDLRRGAGGLEVVLRPVATLQRAAAAELPGLVESLRARGITVARAEVRAQPNGAPAARRPVR
jgi:hypothetical protein